MKTYVFPFSAEETYQNREIPPANLIVVSTVDCTSKVYVRFGNSGGMFPVPSGIVKRLLAPSDGVAVSQIEVRGSSGDTVAFLANELVA